jgi:hypothetical protein
MKIFITLLSILASISAHAVVSCNDMKKEVVKIDQMLDEEKIICPKEVDQKLCEKNYGQLISLQHDLMSELVMLNGLAQLREEAANSAKDLTKFREYDQKELKQKFEQFKSSLKNIDLTQTSFLPSGDGKHLWRDYDDFIESKKLKNDSAGFLQYIEAKCSESKFEICSKKDVLIKDAKYQEILRGLASTLSKKKTLSDPEYAQTIGQYHTLLNLPWEGENKTATAVLQDDRLEQFEKLLDHQDESVTLDQKYDALTRLSSELISVAAWDTATDDIKTTSGMVKDAGKDFNLELGKFLDVMRNAGNVKMNDASQALISQFESSVKSQKNNESVKFKNFKNQYKHIELKCQDIGACRSELAEIAKTTCGDNDVCRVRRDKAISAQNDLLILEKSNVSQKLSNSKACIEKYKNNFKEILICSNLTEEQLDAQRKVAHNKLRDVEKLLKSNASNPQISALKSFKTYALYILRQQPQCLEKNDISIQSPCLEKGINDLGISTFIDDLKQVIAVEAVNFNPSFVRKEGEKIRDFCLEDETLKLFPQICNNTPPIDVSSAIDIPEDDFVPVKVKYNSAKYGHPAMLGVRGLLSAAATTGMMGYVEYNMRVQNANELVTRAKMQQQMNSIYNQQSVYQQTYYNQMAQNYYSMMNQQNMWGSQYYTQGGTYFTGGINPTLFAPQNQSNLGNATFQFDFNQVPSPIDFNNNSSTTTPATGTASGDLFPSFGF